MKVRNALLLALVLVHFALLLQGMDDVYPTADEPAYVAGGYVVLARGKEALDFLAQRGYPPFLATLEALGLYLEQPEIPIATLSGWPDSFHIFAEEFLTRVEPLERTFFVARLPVVWLTVLLGAVVYRWAKSLWGVEAGLLALTALVFDPSLLAHGRLAHTDAGIVALGTTALYALWHWGRTTTWEWAAVSGVLLGLTMLTKVSGVFWTAAAGAGALALVVRSRSSGERARYLRQGVALFGICMAVFWAGYALTWGPVEGLPFPVPAPAYWESIRYLSAYRGEVFALGKRWYEELWWYYPLSFVLKNPLLLLAGWLLGAASLLRRPNSRPATPTFWLFPILYTLIAMTQGMNIGYRHMLPVHPYLHLALGGGLSVWVRVGRRWRKTALLAGCAAYAAGTLILFPQELSYFNLLAGGPEEGYRYLADSNVDWGQTPPGVVAGYVKDHPETRTRPPDTLFRPRAGKYLVKVTHLQGAGKANPYTYEWFRHQEPADALDPAMLIYEVPPFDVDWVAQCNQPAVPLSEEVLHERTGERRLRVVEFSCTEAWIYPAGWQQAGLYAISYTLFEEAELDFPSLLYASPTPEKAFMARHLSTARLSFDKPTAGELPPFILYEASGAPHSSPPPAEIGTAPVATHPEALRALESSPIVLEEGLTFLGAQRHVTGTLWELETWWYVHAETFTRPFSIMAHLTAADGNVIGMADGLGVPPLILRGGDVLVQRHIFPAPPEGQKYWLRTGAYWLDTMEQWNVSGAEGANALFVPLEGE